MARKNSTKNRVYCSVPQCCSRGFKNPELSFHRFPNPKDMITRKENNNTVHVNRRQEWIKVLRIGKEISNRMVVCSLHFQESDYILSPHLSEKPNLKRCAVPSLNLPKPSTYNEDKAIKKEILAQNRKLRYEKIQRKKQLHSNSVEANSNSVETHSNSMEVNLANNSNVPQPSTNTDPEDTDVVPEGSNMHDHLFHLSPEEKECLESLMILSSQNQNTKDEGTQVCSGDLRKPHILNVQDFSEKQLNSLTGIPTLELFNCICEAMSDEINFSNKHCLPVKERLLLVFMRLKLNIPFSSLAIFFGCTAKTASNIFLTFIPILSSFFSDFLDFPSKDSVLANMPKSFESFKQTRIVLDCTEVFVQKTKCQFERIQTYSQYYGGNTIKYMIGVTPDGRISYISKGYGGRVSDKIIFQESGLVRMLHPHADKIMVDKGFLIEDICAEHFIEIIRPPFLRHQKQFSSADAIKTRKIARARVIVERVIQRLKIFKFLQSTIPYSIVHLIDHVFTIIAAITNLNSPLLAEDKFLLQINNLKI